MKKFLSLAVLPTTAAVLLVNICVVRDIDAPVSCKNGDEIAFLPRTFGNEQLPIIFAATKCDMTKSVALTNGGVVCVYAGPKNPIMDDERQSK